MKKNGECYQFFVSKILLYCETIPKFLVLMIPLLVVVIYSPRTDVVIVVIHYL